MLVGLGVGFVKVDHKPGNCIVFQNSIDTILLHSPISGFGVIDVAAVISLIGNTL